VTSPRTSTSSPRCWPPHPARSSPAFPGVAAVRAAAFAAYTLPIERWPTPEHLYSATGLAPATYQSSTITRRGRISRQGLPEHRDALMSIAWGLSQNSDAFKARDAELRARGFRPIQAPVALARPPAGSAGACYGYEPP